MKIWYSNIILPIVFQASDFSGSYNPGISHQVHLQHLTKNTNFLNFFKYDQQKNYFSLFEGYPTGALGQPVTGQPATTGKAMVDPETTKSSDSIRKRRAFFTGCQSWLLSQ